MLLLAPSGKPTTEVILTSDMDFFLKAENAADTLSGLTQTEKKWNLAASAANTLISFSVVSAFKAV